LNYSLLYSETSKRQVRRLHPDIKSHIKNKLEQISENPYLGKHLERELSGYLSFKSKRYRIIYRIREDEKLIEIHYVGHRKDIYELFSDEIRAQRR
jgi:mRNA interferase RelE/StbE